MAKTARVPKVADISATKTVHLLAVAAMGFLNMGGMLFLFDKQVPATSMMILTGVFGVRMALGFRRIKNLERFEKQIKG